MFCFGRGRPMEHRKFLQRLDELVAELTHAQAQKVSASHLLPRSSAMRRSRPVLRLRKAACRSCTGSRDRLKDSRTCSYFILNTVGSLNVLEKIC